MRITLKHISFLLIGIFLSIIAEKTIPHSHNEINGSIVVDWSQSNKDEHHNEEELHSTYIQSENHLLKKADFQPKKFISKPVKKVELPKEIKLRDYNLFPKVINNILFIVRMYSFKSPPFYC